MVALKPGPNQIVIGHDLLTGRVKYLTAAGQWVVDPAEAAFAPDAEAAQALLAQGQAAEEANIIVAPELIAADLVDGRPRPVRLREQIRADGPTMHLDHGYQAQN